MQNFGTIDFNRAAPVAINWHKLVETYLDALPSDGFSPDDDWALVQALSVGKPIPLMSGGAARARSLMDAARDDRGSFSLDGRAALIAVARARARQ